MMNKATKGEQMNVSEIYDEAIGVREIKKQKDSFIYTERIRPNGVISKTIKYDYSKLPEEKRKIYELNQLIPETTILGREFKMQFHSRIDDIEQLDFLIDTLNQYRDFLKEVEIIPAEDIRRAIKEQNERDKCYLKKLCPGINPLDNGFIHKYTEILEYRSGIGRKPDWMDWE